MLPLRYKKIGVKPDIKGVGELQLRIVKIVEGFQPEGQKHILYYFNIVAKPQYQQLPLLL